MTRHRIKIRSSMVGKDTDVWIDGEKQKGLVNVTVDWTVNDINYVTLTYLVDDLDVETEAETHSPVSA